MTSYYCTTYFNQNDVEFRCTWDLTATKEEPTSEEIIHHLAAMLGENHSETWNLHEEEEDEDCKPSHFTVDLYGLTPEDFAKELVLNEREAEQNFGLTYIISTRWQEVCDEAYEHPCNL